jgi:hypothetical protein
MSQFGYVECRAFVSEDYTLTVTIEGSGSIASGWTFAGHLYDPSGTEIVGAVSVAITDAANRVITATIAGLNLSPTTYYAPYRFEILRTDAGARTVVAWGKLELETPVADPPN